MKFPSKLFLSISIFLFLLGKGRAQQINVYNGPEYKDPAGTSITSLIGEDKSGLYTLRYKYRGKDEIYIEKYDPSMNLVFSNLINLPVMDKNITFSLQGIYYLNNKFYLFLSKFDKAADLNILYAGFLDPSGNISNEMFELSKIDAVSRRNAGAFNISLSVDSSKICVQKNEIYDKNENERFGFSVFNLDFKLLWAKNVELPIKDQNYSISKTVVDKDGNIHLFAEIYVPRKEREKGDPNSYYEVFSYFHKEATVKQYEISLGDNVISGLDIRLDKNNNLIGTGFYSEKKEYRMKGIFYFSIDPKTKQVKSTNTQEFTTEFLAQFMSQKKAEKGKELANFKIRNILVNDDGSATMVSEYYVRYIRTYTTKNGTRTVTTWYFNDLIVSRINPNGKVAWFSKIPKKQTTSANGHYYTDFGPARYMGISSFLIGDKLHIIYNENPKNLTPGTDPTKVKYMNNARKSITTLVTITPDGKLEKVPLFPARDAKSIVTPRFNLQLSKNSVLMYGDRGKTYRFLKLNF